MSGWFTTLLNCRLCLNGELVRDQLVVSDDSGLILPRTGYIGGDAVDLEDGIIAPGFLELQTNGLLGFHFTSFQDEKTYAVQIDGVSRYLATQGVTGFYPTIPTVSSRIYQKILPSLRPREIDGGASLLGAHAEGPYLHPDKKGAHDANLFIPAHQSPLDTYGSPGSSSDILKLVTLAPDLAAAASLVSTLVSQGTRISLGHSPATHAEGVSALSAGATCLTHTCNAMSPLHHREPGLAGLVTHPSKPYFTIIADGQHLHPSVVTLLHRADPSRAILVTDSVELLGLADGVHPGNLQIIPSQRKHGNRATIDSTDTLVGGCVSLAQCMRNLMQWSGCSIAEAVRCITENPADMMGLADRGRLQAGQRADFVVLNDEGEVLQTWIAGRKVWDATEGQSS